MMIETLIDPILRYSNVSPALCSQDRLHGYYYLLLLFLNYATWVAVARAVWKCMGYFGWWRAVWREINGTREELGLMAEEEW